MSKIPEVIDLDVQAAKLVSMFGDSHAFDLVRGKCGSELLAVTDTLMKELDGSPKGPDRGVFDLKNFFGALSIVRGKIAQLERDGFTLAAHEVREALTRVDYRMLGEVEQSEEIVPMTLIIFNPEMMLSVLSIKQTEHWFKVAEIPKVILQGINRYHEWEFKNVIGSQDLFKLTDKINQSLYNKLVARIAKKYKRDWEHFRSSNTLPGEGQLTKIGMGAFAGAIYGKKDVVLRCFSRQEQKQIGLWEVHIPKKSFDAREKEGMLYFGLHKEAEHANWEKIRKPFCSTGVSHGYGAIAYPGEAYHCFDKKSERFKGTRILLSN